MRTKSQGIMTPIFLATPSGINLNLSRGLVLKNLIRNLQNKKSHLLGSVINFKMIKINF